jgi:hypothetical protein
MSKKKLKQRIDQLESVIAELALEVGRADGRITKAEETHTKFVDMDKVWSDKVGEGLVACIDQHKVVEHQLKMLKAVIVGVAKDADISEDRTLEIVDEAADLVRIADAVDPKDLEGLSTDEKVEAVINAVKKVIGEQA